MSEEVWVTYDLGGDWSISVPEDWQREEEEGTHSFWSDTITIWVTLLRIADEAGNPATAGEIRETIDKGNLSKPVHVGNVALSQESFHEGGTDFIRLYVYKAGKLGLFSACFNGDEYQDTARSVLSTVRLQDVTVRDLASARNAN